MKIFDAHAAQTHLMERLVLAGVSVDSVEAKAYPEETIFVVHVLDKEFSRAIEVASEVDELFLQHSFSGFVTVRKSPSGAARADSSGGARGVQLGKASDLANLLAARSRTSEVQPSLEYIKDASSQLESVLTARNHLIFGRRGAGKTTLMVEAKRRLEEQNHAVVWLNVQTHRHSAPEVIFLWTVSAIIEQIQTYFGNRAPKILADVSSLQDSVTALLSRDEVASSEVFRIVPHVQRVCKRFLSAAGCRLFIFLDDLHYLKRGDQPRLLDMVHGVTRDIDGWIKVACIKHLSRWFEHTPPLGLQTGHDADHVELDLTLESPSEAKLFLDKVINVYARHVGLASARSVFSEEALNRLVLASGAVPRDYLILAASTIKTAKKRQNARLAGVQDVNRAAGEQSKVKIAELEDDAASGGDAGAKSIIRTLGRVREFCIDEQRFSFFKVDFRDKESHQIAYALIQGLLDVRIVHLVASSLSDKREAGRRAEVFMLDLSQFSGQRLKKRLHVLDFVDSHLVLKQTSSKVPDQRGDSPAKLLDILRRGPSLDLSTIRVN
jgi:hypothetical protein